MTNERLRSIISVAGIVIVAIAAFVLLGPPSSAGTADRFRALTPANADAGEPYVVPEDAGPTQREIARQFKAVQARRDDPGPYAALGLAYLQEVRETGDPTGYLRAEAALDEALRIDPDHLDALVGKGTLLLAQHRFEAALEVGRRAERVSPSTARVHGVIVDALTELGRYDEAVQAAQTMIDLRPDLGSWSRVSYQREIRGDLAGAIDAMERALKAAGGGLAENREYLRALLGDLHLLEGDTRTATRAYTTVLASLPDYPPALAGLARAHAAEDELDRAIDLLQNVVDRQPLPEHVVALGELQEAAGRSDEARDTYELARAIQKLYAANGTDVDLELARFEADHGDPQAAVELARDAYERAPSVHAADALGWALFKAGDLEGAQRHATEALRLGSPYASFRYHAGSIAAARGDASAAREHLERALDASVALPPLQAAHAETLLSELIAGGG